MVIKWSESRLLFLTHRAAPLCPAPLCSAQPSTVPGPGPLGSWGTAGKGLVARLRPHGESRPTDRNGLLHPACQEHRASDEGARDKIAEKGYEKSFSEKDVWKCFHCLSHLLAKKESCERVTQSWKCFYNLFKTFRMKSLSALKSLVCKFNTPTCFD